MNISITLFFTSLCQRNWFFFLIFFQTWMWVFIGRVIKFCFLSLTVRIFWQNDFLFSFWPGNMPLDNSFCNLVIIALFFLSSSHQTNESNTISNTNNQIFRYQYISSNCQCLNYTCNCCSRVEIEKIYLNDTGEWVFFKLSNISTRDADYLKKIFFIPWLSRI
jgi:hypothetical protein